MNYDCNKSQYSKGRAKITALSAPHEDTKCLRKQIMGDNNNVSLKKNWRYVIFHN